MRLLLCLTLALAAATAATTTNATGAGGGRNDLQAIGLACHAKCGIVPEPGGLVFPGRGIRPEAQACYLDCVMAKTRGPR